MNIAVFDHRKLVNYLNSRAPEEQSYSVEHASPALAGRRTRYSIYFLDVVPRGVIHSLLDLESETRVGTLTVEHGTKFGSVLYEDIMLKTTEDVELSDGVLARCVIKLHAEHNGHPPCIKREDFLRRTLLPKKRADLAALLPTDAFVDDKFVKNGMNHWWSF